MSDYNFLMETRLSPEQFAVIALLSRLAAEQGLNLYLVGGAVRDLTYGQQVVRDLDFSVEGQPQRILRALPLAKSERGARTDQPDATPVLEYQEFDEHFSAAELLFSNGVRAELAMSRQDIYSRPGQRPEVHAASIFEDLKRRDFAINAMAISLHPNSRGLLLDPTNGAGDLERREIRALQSRGFLDDPSRIYRMLRLGLRLDLKTEERTERWLETAWQENAWERLDANQQARELAAILNEDQPARVLKLLAEKKILAGLDKKLASVHIPYDRFARLRTVLPPTAAPHAFLLNFHFLVEKLGPEHKARLAKTILRDSKAIKLATGLEHEGKKLERLLASERASLPSQVQALLSPQPKVVLLYVLASTQSVKVQNRIKNFLHKFPEVYAQLPRAELQALGVKPGPEFERIMAQVFSLQLDGKLKSHPHLMKALRDLAGVKEAPAPPPPPKKAKETAAAPVPAHAGKTARPPAVAPSTAHRAAHQPKTLPSPAKAAEKARSATARRPAVPPAAVRSGRKAGKR